MAADTAVFTLEDVGVPSGQDPRLQQLRAAVDPEGLMVANHRIPAPAGS